MISHGISTSIGKKPYIFVIFRGGGPDLPLDPHIGCKILFIVIPVLQPEDKLKVTSEHVLVHVSGHRPLL